MSLMRVYRQKALQSRRPQGIIFDFTKSISILKHKREILVMMVSSSKFILFLVVGLNVKLKILMQP